MSNGLNKTPFFDMHVAAGARMVPFAGYEMPVQYQGIKAEHLHTRSQVGLFDVSHMGQLLISGETAPQEIEALVPVDLDELDQDQMCLTMLLNEQGGILDDLIITKRNENEFFLVVNGACKHEDIAHIKKHLVDAKLDYFESQALLALQGPKAFAALCDVLPEVKDAINDLTFMHGVSVSVERQFADDTVNFDLYISRSGYTGEDGFELSLPSDIARDIAKMLLNHDAVAWVGLGARDSLRLEAGLCLYGHDLDAATTPIEAGFLWSIDKSRRANGSKAGGFLGANTILNQIESGVSRRRRGFVVESKIPVREGADIVDQDGRNVGVITSGGVAPSFGGLIAMGYVSTASLASNSTQFFAVVRAKQVPLKIHSMPFLAAKYKR